MTLRAVIFTHGPDYPAATIATAALELLGVEVWWAIDRHEAAAPPEGRKVVRTDFERGGNLNGIGCVIGILETLLAVGRGADRVWKVDSDTMVLCRDWSTGHDEPLVGMTHVPVRGPTGIFGLAYAFRPEALPAFIEVAKTRGETAQRAEDMVMGELGGLLGCHRHPFHWWSGVFSAWNWSTVKPVSLWVGRYQVLGVQPPPGVLRDEGRRRVAGVMEEIFKAQWT